MKIRLLLILMTLCTVYPTVLSHQKCKEKPHSMMFRMEEKSIKSKPQPQYTEEARRHQIIGTVLLRAVFHSSGQIKDVCVVEGLPYGLTRKAVQAAYKIKFEPVMKDGYPVSVTRYIEYSFSLY